MSNREKDERLNLGPMFLTIVSEKRASLEETPILLEYFEKMVEVVNSLGEELGHNHPGDEFIHLLVATHERFGFKTIRWCTKGVNRIQPLRLVDVFF